MSMEYEEFAKSGTGFDNGFSMQMPGRVRI